MLRNRINYFFYFLAIICLTGWPGKVMAQSPVSVKTTSRNILIGDQINIWLSYKQANQLPSKVKWPILPDSISGLIWVEKGKVDTLKNHDSLILKQKLTVTGFDSGNYYIPSFTFTLIDSGNIPQVIHTDSLLVQVKTIAVDTTKAYKPIKGVRQMKFTWMDYWQQIALGIIALIIIVLVLLYFLKWRRKKEPAESIIPPEKAHEQALRQLEELKKKKLWQSGEIKQYYESLSLIVRSYLENRFTIVALERTTDELLKETHKMRELKPFRKHLRMILQTADLAKFARATPLPEEHENCMQAAEDIIIKTQLIAEEGSEK